MFRSRSELFVRIICLELMFTGHAMGLWDRDYWRERKAKQDWKDSYYDPKQFRGGRQAGSSFRSLARGTSASDAEVRNQRQSAIKRFSVWSLLLWVVVLGFLWFGFENWEPRQRLGQFGPQPVKSEVTPDSPKCVPLPASGALQRFSSTSGGQDSLATMEVINNHNMPVVALVSDLGSGQKLQALVVGYGSRARLQLPSGQYDLIFHAGEEARWCNLSKGFSGGATVHMNGGVVLQGSTTTQVILKNTANKADGFSVSYNSAKLEKSDFAKSSAGRGVLRLTQTKDGHYFAGGSVNGFPVVFMLDTGATNVAISSSTAARAGIDRCAAKTYSTANGSVQACATTVKEVTFGSFRLQNVEVAIMPNMQGGALLGMNVLKRFRLEQSDGELTVTYR